MIKRAELPVILRWFVPKTIRAQLLVSVNTVLLLLVVVALAYDYESEMTRRIAQRQLALQEEAARLLVAVREIRHHGRDMTQKYLDAVCATTHDSQSPEHHIAIELGSDTIQARSHGRQSEELLSAIRTAANLPLAEQADVAGIVVGAAEHGDTTAYVTEAVADIRVSVRGDTVHRSAAIFGLAMVAAAVVNVVVGQFVVRPLRRLVAVVNRIGSGELGVQTRMFHSDELNFLAAEINSMSDRLARNDQDRRAQMAKARSIQLDLLPTDVEIRCLEHASLFHPVDEVGGDYYDIVPLGDDGCLVCIADVAGHGIPAAMTAAIVKSLLLEATNVSTGPAEILAFINRRLLDVSPKGNFVTMALATYHPASAQVQFASAGHETAYLQHMDGESVALGSTGLILGVSVEARWNDVTIDVREAARLLLVTDGVVETFDSDQVMFGRDRIATLIEGTPRCTVDGVVQRLNEHLTRFRGTEKQQDDVTIVAVDFQSDRAPTEQC